MATTQRSTAVGVFDSRGHAEQALQELRRAGFRDDDLGLVSPDQGRAETVNVTDPDKAKVARVTGETKAEEGAAAGAVTGGVLGGALALAVGLIPGVGPVLSLGALAPTLFGVGFGAVAGAASGGLLGALIGMDFPEEEARFYEGELKAGRTLVGVKAGDRYAEAVAILNRFGGYDVNTRHAAQPARMT